MARFALSLAGVALYATLTVLTYWAYIHLFPVDVVLYAAVWAACLALFAYGALVFIASFARTFSPLEKTQNLVICALLGYALALTFPTVIDRSLSFYILEKLQQRGGAIQVQHLDKVFQEEYVREHRLMDVRLTEQLQSGTVQIDAANCLRLTPRGDRLARFSRFFRAHWLPPRRLVAGAYTQDLVDPFARDAAVPDYLCKPRALSE